MPPPISDSAAPDPGGGVTHTQKGFHIPSLDGIRAVSFMVVFISHAITERVPGGFGVTVFFFLSGYLITTLMRLEHERTGSISLTKFYARRALRIFPNFYLVLLVATALAMLGVIRVVGDEAAGISPWAFFWQAAYGNNYYSIFGHDAGTALGTGVFWSLAVEEHFYLLFPALFILLYRHVSSLQARAGILVGLCAAVLAWRCVVALLLDVPRAEYTYKASDARFDSMLFGCALALVGNPALDTSRRPGSFWILVATPAALALLAVTFVVRDELFRQTLRYTLQGLALVPLFIAAIRCHRHPAFAWLNWRFVRFFGVLSYSLYLVHLIVVFRIAELLHADASPARRLLAAGISLAISFGIAVAIHFAVERPLAVWRRRLHR